jgi:hypothetical protein
MKKIEEEKISLEVIIIYLITRLLDTKNDKEDLGRFINTLLKTKFCKKYLDKDPKKMDPLELQFLSINCSNSFIDALISKMEKGSVESFHSFEAVNAYLKQSISNVLNFEQIENGTKVDVSALAIQYLFALILKGDEMKKLEEIEIILNVDAR